MTAVLLNGHGGTDQLELRHDVPVPRPAEGQVLVQVAACGMNNTDVNTRIGWYSPSVRGGTGSLALETGAAGVGPDDGGWSSDLGFPRIQGGDAAGLIVAVGEGGDDASIGTRVLLDPWWLPPDPTDLAAARVFGSEVDGGFAQYAVCPAENALPINSDLTDAELASFPIATVTAENLLTRADVGAGDVVVVLGASGGVGSAAIQLAVDRGAVVVGVASAAKHEAVLALGAHEVVDRSSDSLAEDVRVAAPGGRVDVLVDVVGGSMFNALLPVIRRGGRYTCAGAIAGPIVELDLRTLYLHDLVFTGATVCPPGTFARVVDAIERGVVRPVVAEVYPLADIVVAQERFGAKDFVGNLVLEIPRVG